MASALLTKISTRIYAVLATLLHRKVYRFLALNVGRIRKPWVFPDVCVGDIKKYFKAQWADPWLLLTATGSGYHGFKGLGRGSTSKKRTRAANLALAMSVCMRFPGKGGRCHRWRRMLWSSLFCAAANALNVYTHTLIFSQRPNWRTNQETTLATNAREFVLLRQELTA